MEVVSVPEGAIVEGVNLRKGKWNSKFSASWDVYWRGMTTPKL